ncbi:MAG: hypothetical protein KAS72_13240 [Phycisphaerales bacterium]|nr:hypothetical protein [Phycisphaerales bacterium]
MRTPRRRSRYGQLVLTAGVVIGLASTLIAYGQAGGEEGVQPEDKPELPKPAEVIALQFQADWSPSSAALTPSYDELKKAAAKVPVLFVAFDFTSERTHRQAAYLACALDVRELFAEHQHETGQVLLVDAESHEVIGTLTKDDTAKEMSKKLVAALELAGYQDESVTRP